MDETVIGDYQERYDAIKQEFLDNNMTSLFLKLEEISNKPVETKEDENQFATIHNTIVEWNEKVRTMDMIYSSFSEEYQSRIPNPRLFYLSIKSDQ